MSHHQIETDTETVRALLHGELDTFNDAEFAEGIDLEVVTAEGKRYAWFTGIGKTPAAVVEELDRLHIPDLEVAQ